MAVTGTYNSVERVALAAGAFELAFLFVAVMAHPDLGAMARQAVSIPAADPKYMLLVSANIGAVIMPWMVFYQQSAVVEKGLTTADLPAARLDTLLGSVVTQLNMAAVLVAAAASLGSGSAERALDTIEQIADALTPVLGAEAGRLVFGLGVAGAAIVAAIVVTLTAARTLGELLGFPHRLANPLRDAPWFYACYALTATIGPDRVTLVSPVRLDVVNDAATAEFVVTEGQRQVFVLSYVPSDSPTPPFEPERALAETRAYWRNWIARFDASRTKWSGLVKRSLITLRAMAHIKLQGGRAKPVG